MKFHLICGIPSHKAHTKYGESFVHNSRTSHSCNRFSLQQFHLLLHFTVRLMFTSKTNYGNTLLTFFLVSVHLGRVFAFVGKPGNILQNHFLNWFNTTASVHYAVSQASPSVSMWFEIRNILNASAAAHEYGRLLHFLTMNNGYDVFAFQLDENPIFQDQPTVE